MPTFGFSAFLRLLSLSHRRQGTELRLRSQPSTGGYDFHRRFRLLAGRYLARGEDYDALVEETASFANGAEQRSARSALEALRTWRGRTPGSLKSFPSKTYESSRGRFKVSFTPDFAVQIDGQWVAVHIWNTASTDLDFRMTYAALALFTDAYDSEPERPDDLAVLSIPDERLVRLSDVEDHTAMAARVVAALENRMDELAEAEHRDGPGIAPTITTQF